MQILSSNLFTGLHRKFSPVLRGTELPVQKTGLMMYLDEETGYGSACLGIQIYIIHEHPVDISHIDEIKTYFINFSGVFDFIVCP
jgi:hypothetical protein